MGHTSTDFTVNTHLGESDIFVKTTCSRVGVFNAKKGLKNVFETASSLEDIVNNMTIISTNDYIVTLRDIHEYLFENHKSSDEVWGASFVIGIKNSTYFSEWEEQLIRAYFEEAFQYIQKNSEAIFVKINNQVGKVIMYKNEKFDANDLMGYICDQVRKRVDVTFDIAFTVIIPNDDEDQ